MVGAERATWTDRDRRPQMRMTKLGHACVRLEKDGTALVIDPGTWSDADAALSGASAVLITHEHADHRVRGGRRGLPPGRLAHRPRGPRADPAAAGGRTVAEDVGVDRLRPRGGAATGVRDPRRPVQRQRPRANPAHAAARGPAHRSALHPAGA